MKILTAIINFLLFFIGLFLVSVVATFFLSIFMRENVELAVELFKNILKIP